MSLINKAEKLAALLPHGAGMSLFDAVELCSDSKIIAHSTRHQATDYPFCDTDSNNISSILLVEYGAQAAALHARLNAEISPHEENQKIFIGSVRDLVLHLPEFQSSDGQLTITAELQFGDKNGAIYLFAATINDEPLAEGKMALLRQ